MPTARPIITASVGATLVRLVYADSSEMPVTARTTPISAVNNGRPIATTDPNASSSTMMATAKPMSSDGGASGWTASDTGSPLNATLSTAGAACRTALMIDVISSLSSAAAGLSKRTSMNAIWPSGETVTSDVGSAGITTFGSAASCLRSASSWAGDTMSASFVPAGASTAMRIVAPD